MNKRSVADLFEQVSSELARTDAAVYRRIGEHIATTKQSLAELARQETGALALLYGGDFSSMSQAALRKLCSSNGIKGVSKLKSPELIAKLKTHGIQPPATPIEKLKKDQLVAIVKELLERS